MPEYNTDIPSDALDIIYGITDELTANCTIKNIRILDKCLLTLGRVINDLPTDAVRAEGAKDCEHG